MTGNLLPLYACAALTVTTLGAFARQNQKSGWKRHRPNLVEALDNFYKDLGFDATEPAPIEAVEWKPMTSEEAIDFSAQMLKLRTALGTGMPVTEISEPVHEEELALQ